jgi:hypothetical protein
MTTIYTVNNKVLKNAANDKWLTKKEPVRFVMNASNATLSQDGAYQYVTWESPAYPSAYDGGGKQFIIVNNNSAEVTAERMIGTLDYVTPTSGGGPIAINSTIMQTIGTSTGTLNVNTAPAYGVYLATHIHGTEEVVREFLANFTITILDP